MHLPINIEDLLRRSVVESDRLELKAGWNPEAVLHTICAFANDFNNFGGGYIIIGIEEENGQPLLPPKGLNASQLDSIQKDLVRICSFLKPIYTPIVSIEKYQNQDVLVIWVPGGHTRPYSAPVSLGKNNKEYKYYIRKLSSTVIARDGELKELHSLAATVPFDDRVNHHADLNKLSLRLIQNFLDAVGSKLLQESARIPFVDLCRQMAIVDGGDEYLKPRNFGLLFFSDEPEKFFPYIQIDVVYFPDGEGGDRIEEAIFKGPLHEQLRSALRHIRNNYITERVIKVPDQAEAIRFFNYPYDAVEEALVNAVYHRSYEIREPIEVRINLDKIEVLSFPGPDSSISPQALTRKRIVPRRYRNRRVGDLLKELKFTEGRSTGMPKIYRALEHNGSPPPHLETNDERTYFLIEIPIHPEMLPSTTSPEVTDQVTDEVMDEVTDKAFASPSLALSDTELKLLRLCLKKPAGRQEILAEFGHKSLSGNVRQALKRLKEEGLIGLTIENKPSSKKQQYKITQKGKNVLTKHL